MKKVTTITILLLLIVSNISVGQVELTRQVIGSTGSYITGSSFSVSSTVGEAVIQTLFPTNMILTQGFQQTFKPNDSLVEYEVINESCVGAKNGSIYINDVVGCPGPYSVVITSVNDTDTQLGPDTLETGDYNVDITSFVNGCTYPSFIINVGLDSEKDCILKFYSGITPNDDGINDVWWIDNIELFLENTVQIFNRWGDEVWYGKNYDNNTVVWRGNSHDDFNSGVISNSGFELADATYFYVVRVGDRVFKGWVELTR